MRAGIYTRISRDEDGDGLGVRRQEDDCRDVCDRRGWKVSEVFVDNDVSAYSGRQRPRYEDLVAAVAQGSVDAIVAWAPERLHRSPRELEDFIELVERTGCAVETVKAGAWDVSTSHGRLVARMLGAVARSESERTGERVRRAHQQAKADGKWRGPIPYGMRPSSTPGLPETNPAEAPLVRDILDRAQRGDALTAIASDLNRAGVRPRRGQAWTHTGVARLIASPALGGLVKVDSDYRQAAFEGIVEASDWHAVQQALRRRPKGERSRPRQVLSLLGGILRCADHGVPCFASASGTHFTYQAVAPGRCYVSSARRSTDALVTALVVQRLRRPDAMELLRPVTPMDSSQEQAEELRRRREEIIGLIGDGVISRYEARPQLESLAESLQRLEVPRLPAPSILSETDLVDPAKAWSDWTVVQRREVLRVLFDSIAIKHIGFTGGPRMSPARFVIEWATA